MAAFVLLCLVLYTIASFVVGLRLILRSRQSHGLPELLIGLTYFSAAGLGYPIAVLGRLLPDRSDQVLAVWLGQPLIVFGCCCFLFFNAKVFRPGVSWATLVAMLGSLVLVVGGSITVWGYTSTADAALDRLWPAEAGSLPIVATSRLLAMTWLGYLVGAVTGGLLLHAVAWPLIVPAVLLVVVVLL